MTNDSKSQISLADVNALRRAGVINADQYLAATQSCRDASYWRMWAMRAFLVLGAGHLLAGVIFFFAYNWDDLAPFTKFGLLQAGIAFAVVLSLVTRSERPGGQALLIAASVFVGVLFAVIGQVYQTGADAYELFTVWAVLILPWVVASRSSAHWFVWVVICLTAFSFYGTQVLLPLDVIGDKELSTAVGIAAIAFLVARELAVINGADWLDDRWLRVSLALIGVAILFLPAFSFVFDWNGVSFSLVAFATIVLVLAAVYTKTLAEFAVVAIVIGFASLLLMGLGARGIHEIIGFNDGTGSLIFSLFLLVLWCAMLTAGSVRLLNTLYRQTTVSDADE